jgi:hypothetical protein
MKQYTTFYFDSYRYDSESAIARFRYSFNDERFFEETITFFDPHPQYDTAVIERAFFLAFCVIGTSYYKCFPVRDIVFKQGALDQAQAEFCQTVYTEGLSQFMFENDLSLEQMAQFTPGASQAKTALSYDGRGIVMLQSGGKDSLLLAALAEEQNLHYTPLYISSGQHHPAVLNSLAYPLRSVVRTIDREALRSAAEDGALNGHIPVTYIVQAIALIDAILHNQSIVLAAIGREGNEAHEHIGDLAVNHQWSKTWQAEQLFAQYVADYVASDLHVGSPLRGLSELRIAELFTEKAWQRFGQAFSSCNRANYRQESDNRRLTWCGECPKCANSFLLFAPFIEPVELMNLFGGRNLFNEPGLVETFKGLLDIDGVMKPFECIGEVNELRLAYHMARRRFSPNVYNLPFGVPESTFDYLAIDKSQPWTTQLIAV